MLFAPQDALTRFLTHVWMMESPAAFRQLSLQLGSEVQGHLLARQSMPASHCICLEVPLSLQALHGLAGENAYPPD